MGKTIRTREEVETKIRGKNSKASNSIGGDNDVLCAYDGGATIKGYDSNININEASVMLRFLSIIEEQGRTITRLQEEIIRLCVRKR